MKRLLLAWMSAFSFACGAAEVEEPAPSAGDGAPEGAEVAARGPLSGTEFLPAPLRPSDPVLSELDTYRGAVQALRDGEARAAALGLDRARREQSGHPELAALQAWALLLAGDAGDAARVAQPAAAAGCGPAEYALGRALYASGDRAGAHPWFERCRGRQASSAGFLPWAAESALAATAPRAALRDLEPMLLDGALPAELALIRARALAMAGRADEAVSQFDQLLQASARHDPAIWNETGAVRFRSALEGEDPEEYARAAGYFRRATDLDPQDARFRFNLACALDWGGQPAEAEASYERALELRPGYLEAYENLVLLLKAQDRLDDVLAAERQMLRQPLTPEELQRVLAAGD